MKFMFSQIAFMVDNKSNKRNLIFMVKFTIFVVVLVTTYSLLFHYIMALEGQKHSFLTGFYWSLTVMTTLGFGDITFTGDLGKMFTIVVLLSGILLFMLILPFTFIRYVYSPWLESKSQSAIQKEVPEYINNHVVIVGNDGFAIALVRRLKEYNIPYVLIVTEHQQAMELYNVGLHALVGDLDVASTYIRARAEHAALVIALQDDMKNTNIAATVREAAPNVLLAARINILASESILRLAGCNHVFHFAEMLGNFLARRVFNARNHANIVGNFQGLCVAEAPVHHTSLVGQNVVESNLRGRFGLNVCGIWQGNDYMTIRPETIIDESAVLLLAGTEKMIEHYNAVMGREATGEQAPVLILGGGTVAGAIAKSLVKRGIPFRVVEKNAGRIPPNDERYVVGNAAEIEVLQRAGIDSTKTVLVTTHDDDVNIYLTIYCRKLCPDIQIISRANFDRNVPSLYTAGANLVLSQSSLIANSVVNMLSPGRVFQLTEGLNIFRMSVPESLVGVNLIDSGIRLKTGCNVIAIKTQTGLEVPPDPSKQLQADWELLLIADTDSEQLFMKEYGEKGYKKV